MKGILGLALALSVLTAAYGPTASAHWPDQAPHQIANLGEFRLEGGGVIPNLKMSYVTHGKLNAAKDNAILFMHGFGVNHHSIDHLIGPGQALDTDRYFIICSDELGNTQMTFEHSTSPTNSGLKMNFPGYNLRDRVKAEYMLVTQELQIPHLLAVTGISSGGIHSVQFAVSYPDFMDGIFPIVGGGSLTTQGFFFGPWLISIIESCADGMPATTTRTESLRDKHSVPVHTSTLAIGGEMSTPPRPTRSGAISGATTTSTSRMLGISITD
jgi:homoserine O-acetyltransferase